MKKVILFFIRKRLGLKKYEPFKFENQKSAENFYYFTSHGITKCIVSNGIKRKFCKSRVSLNYLLSNECKVFTIK